MGEGVKDCVAALEALAEHEAVIGEFYNVCSTQFGTHAEFWKKLSDAEAKHAAILREACETVKPLAEAPFDPEKVCVPLIESSARFVKRETEKLKGSTGAFIASALSTALKIECSFFDRDVFEVFRDSPVEALRNAAKTLTDETHGHAEDLKRLLTGFTQLPPSEAASPEPKPAEAAKEPAKDEKPVTKEPQKGKAEKASSQEASGKAPKLASKPLSNADAKGKTKPA